MSTTLADKASQIGRSLREAREGAGLTQAEAAERLGVDKQTVSRWERGETAIKAADFERAAALYARQAEAPTVAVGGKVPRGTSLSPRMSALVNAFERDMVRLGASDDEADYIRSALTTEGARKFYMGDRAKPLTADQQEHELKMQMEALKLWVTLRIKARKDAERRK